MRADQPGNSSPARHSPWSISASSSDASETPPPRPTTYHRALKLYRDFGDLEGEATVRRCLGALHRDAGQFEAAGQLFDQALACFRELGNRHGEIGQLLTDTGRFREARDTFTQARALARAIRSQFEHAGTLEGTARTYPSPAENTPPAQLLKEAIEIFRRTGAAPEADSATTYAVSLADRGTNRGSVLVTPSPQRATERGCWCR
ncbi:tetratricopeptide repeat protein, partial [Nocardia sp. NPDC004711]